jgi:hypothetical protein
MATNGRPVHRKEFANSAHGLPQGALAGPLRGTAKQIADFVVSKVGDPDYHAVCSLDNLAAHFQTSVATLRNCLRAATQTGLIEIQGVYVYPRPLLLCMSTPKLGQTDAAQIVRYLKHSGPGIGRATVPRTSQ